MLYHYKICKSFKTVIIPFTLERFWKESYEIICIVENRPQYRFLYVSGNNDIVQQSLCRKQSLSYRDIYAGISYWRAGAYMRNLTLSEREDEKQNDNIINTGPKEDIWIRRK